MRGQNILVVTENCSETLSPFLLTRILTAARLWIVMSFCMLLTFVLFFSSCFCLFLRQILAETEKALSKTKPVHVRISSDFCCLLITYANSLDPDQNRGQVRFACKKVVNFHGQENQFFNDRHKIIANNIIKSRDKFLWELY